MQFTQKEIDSDFDKLYSYISNSRLSLNSKTFKLIYIDKEIDATFDTMFDDDNGLYVDDPNYEYFNSIVFCNIKTQELFIVNCKKMPESIYCNGEQII